MPKFNTINKATTYVKEEVKKHFTCDVKMPRWVQNCECPFNKNGKPMVFSHQEKAKGGDIRTYYYFYDKDTKEETVIKQFD